MCRRKNLNLRWVSLDFEWKHERVDLPHGIGATWIKLRAKTLLSNVRSWNKQDNRDCAVENCLFAYQNAIEDFSMSTTHAMESQSQSMAHICINYENKQASQQEERKLKTLLRRPCVRGQRGTRLSTQLVRVGGQESQSKTTSQQEREIPFRALLCIIRLRERRDVTLPSAFLASACLCTHSTVSLSRARSSLSSFLGCRMMSYFMVARTFHGLSRCFPFLYDILPSVEFGSRMTSGRYRVTLCPPHTNAHHQAELWEKRKKRQTRRFVPLKFPVFDSCSQSLARCYSCTIAGKSLAADRWARRERRKQKIAWSAPSPPSL